MRTEVPRYIYLKGILPQILQHSQLNPQNQKTPPEEKPYFNTPENPIEKFKKPEIPFTASVVVKQSKWIQDPRLCEKNCIPTCKFSFT